jgi:hypothetical protein
MNEVGLRVRVDEELRREFVEICRIRDTTASQVIRAHMRAYVETFGADLRQKPLFGPDDSGSGNG